MHSLPATPVTLSADTGPATVVAAEVPAARPLVTRIVSASTGHTVTVVAGNTLSGIAGQSCGSRQAWRPIWRQNQAQVPNPDLIYPGQKLTFTCDGTAVSKSAPAAVSGKTYGVSYGDPNYCGDGDGDGWDVACPAAPAASAVPVQAPVQSVPAPAVQPVANVTGVSGGTLTVAGLEALWDSVGGPPADAAAAAAVAECESGGQQYAHNPSGASGYWQILGEVVPGNVYDPVINAENAVAKFKASGDTWAQWVCQP